MWCVVCGVGLRGASAGGGGGGREGKKDDDRMKKAIKIQARGDTHSAHGGTTREATDGLQVARCSEKKRTKDGEEH